jgi:hypothetical protein
MSPVVLAIPVLSLYLVFYRFYAKGVLPAVNIRRERASQPA